MSKHSLLLSRFSLVNLITVGAIIPIVTTVKVIINTVATTGDTPFFPMLINHIAAIGNPTESSQVCTTFPPLSVSPRIIGITCNSVAGSRS